MSQNRIRDDYIRALRLNTLDSSEFILLTAGLLENIGLRDSSQQKELQDIKKLYLEQNYKVAIQKLLAICNQNIFDRNLLTLVQNKSQTLLDRPVTNFSRRYFETEFAQALGNENRAKETYKSVGKISDFIYHETHVGLGQVTSQETANRVISQFLRFNDNIEVELKRHSPKYKAKDRSFKEGIRPDSRSETTSSRNKGIMVSSQPNFYDRISETDLKNSVPDRFTIDNNNPGYSSAHPETPMVGSISGTTFTLVALLERYMIKNKADPNLQTDVNNIVKQFIQFYINNGYHSYTEMTDVLKEPHIQQLFKTYNVALELNLSNSALQVSFNQAREYTLRTCLKKAMQEELVASIHKTPEQNIRLPEILNTKYASLNVPGDEARKKRTEFIKAYLILDNEEKKIVLSQQKPDDLQLLQASLLNRIKNNDFAGIPVSKYNDAIKEVNEFQILNRNKTNKFQKDVNQNVPYELADHDKLRFDKKMTRFEAEKVLKGAAKDKIKKLTELEVNTSNAGQSNKGANEINNQAMFIIHPSVMGKNYYKATAILPDGNLKTFDYKVENNVLKVKVDNLNNWSPIPSISSHINKIVHNNILEKMLPNNIPGEVIVGPRDIDRLNQSQSGNYFINVPQEGNYIDIYINAGAFNDDKKIPIIKPIRCHAINGAFYTADHEKIEPRSLNKYYTEMSQEEANKFRDIDLKFQPIKALLENQILKLLNTKSRDSLSLQKREAIETLGKEIAQISKDIHAHNFDPKDHNDAIIKAIKDRLRPKLEDVKLKSRAKHTEGFFGKLKPYQSRVQGNADTILKNDFNPSPTTSVRNKIKF